jgi:hypothetical protein
MVYFDGYASKRSDVYARFRTSFIHGYVDGSPASLDDETIDRLIDLRVDALSAWLDDLDHAPAGIKNASSTWLATLRGFVVDHRRRSGR